MLNFETNNIGDVPLNRCPLLKSVINKRLTKIYRQTYKEYYKKSSFSDIDGALFLEFNNQAIIGFFCSDELNSVIVWIEKDDNKNINPKTFFLYDEEMFTFEASECDDIDYQNLIGQKILSIDIVHQFQHIKPASHGFPNQVALVLYVENDCCLLLSHYLMLHPNRPIDFEVNISNTNPFLDGSKYNIKKCL